MNIEESFSYHAPNDEHQIARYQSLRAMAKQFAHLITAVCPASRERSLALTNLQQAVMWANSSIAINEAPKD